MLIPEKQVCKHAREKTGEVDGREVVVQVEDAVHEEEGQVVDGPGTEQLGTGQQVDSCGGVVHPPEAPDTKIELLHYFSSIYNTVFFIGEDGTFSQAYHALSHNQMDIITNWTGFYSLYIRPC